MQKQKSQSKRMQVLLIRNILHGTKQLCILDWFPIAVRLMKSQWCVCFCVHVCDCQSNSGIKCFFQPHLTQETRRNYVSVNVMKIGALQRKWILVNRLYRRKDFTMSSPLIRPKRAHTGESPKRSL